MSEPTPSPPVTTSFEVSIPRCAAEVMNDEIVALNVETGVYYSIRDLGVAAWNDLASGYPVERLSSCMHAVVGSDEKLLEFVSVVFNHGLMRECEAKGIEGEPSLAAALRGGQRDFTVEVFEDMKDLILSDPIHDVDEARGWPSPAPGAL